MAPKQYVTTRWGMGDQAPQKKGKPPSSRSEKQRKRRAVMRQELALATKQQLETQPWRWDHGKLLDAQGKIIAHESDTALLTPRAFQEERDRRATMAYHDQRVREDRKRGRPPSSPDLTRAIFGRRVPSSDQEYEEMQYSGTRSWRDTGDWY